jgi:ligand-binding sensor domain-containing protein
VAGTAVLKSYTPAHYITDYLQDHLGNVWFTTLEGVFVFDGRTWKSYKEDVFNAKETYAILEDDHYDIWVGTENGISRFHDGNWLTYRKKEGLKANNVYRIEKDLRGRIWAWSKNDLKFCGLSLYENESWESYDQKDFKFKKEVEKHIMLNDTIIVFANDGLAMFSQSGWHHFNQKDGLSDRHYNQLFVDREHQTWLAGESGLFRYEKGSWKLEVQTQNKCMPTNIFVDKQGRVWAGTSSSGVYLIEFGKHSYFDEADGLSGGAVSDIFEDKFGNTWIITKKGITKFDWSFAKR